MSTILKFANKFIPGTTTSFQYDSPELSIRRIRYWDIIGESEVVGKRLGRPVILTHLIHENYAEYTDLKIALRDSLDFAIGSHGRLELVQTVHGDTFVESLSNVTFEKWERLPLDGQELAGPLKDIAGTLFGLSDQPDEGWFQFVQLNFRQLIV